MISAISPQNRKISFHSKKPVIRLGEQVIREFNNEFPKIKSSSALGIKILNNQDNPRVQHILPDLNRVRNIQLRDFFSMSDNIEFETLDVFMKSTANLIKKNKLANCAEMAELIQYNLLKKGVKCHIIRLRVVDKTTGKVLRKDSFQHYFVVLNLNEAAKSEKSKFRYKDPKSWGNKAVIVDPWNNCGCDFAFNMIQKYERIFKVDKDNEILRFKKKDYFDVTEYLKNGCKDIPCSEFH